MGADDNDRVIAHKSAEDHCRHHADPQYVEGKDTATDAAIQREQEQVSIMAARAKLARLREYADDASGKMLGGAEQEATAKRQSGIEVIPVSAKDGDNIDRVVRVLSALVRGYRDVLDHAD
jgi:hypothetical protein